MGRVGRAVILVLVFVVAPLVALDVGTRIAVERISARELRNSPEIDAGDVETSVDSVPFLGRLLVSGETSFSIGLDDVTERGLSLDRIEFDVDGVVFNRREAINRRVQVDDVEQVRATVVIEEDTISDTVGVPVELEPGSARAAGVNVGLEMDGRDVRVSVAGIGAVSFPVPSTGYLSCEPSLVVARNRLEASCTTDTLPPLVNQALGEVNP